MTLYIGDVRDGLRKFAADGVRAQTCVTSPPYWGLRDYGHAGQIGLEPTPDAYVATMVDVFRCVRDVLADDGTLWLNLGDSYASDVKGSGGTGKSTLVGTPNDGNGQLFAPRRVAHGVKPKDLVGVPWRVAFALQADGWYLRSDIIWAKPNPMPESVTDRPTKAHEYLFLLTKRERYYYDAAAIAEAATPQNRTGKVGYHTPKHIEHRNASIATGGTAKGTLNGPSGDTRNRRTVWSITTEPYAEAHFAVMPTALVEPCVLAGSRPGDTVLDPFMGSGTVARVAASLGRQWIGCELNPDYAAMVGRRSAQQGMALV